MIRKNLVRVRTDKDLRKIFGKRKCFFVEEKKKRRRKRRKNIEGKEKLLRGRWMGWAYGRKSKALIRGE